MNVLEAYGYSAKQFGGEIVTDCPTLLAVPAIQKRVGLADIGRVDLGRRRARPDPRMSVARPLAERAGARRSGAFQSA